MNEDAMGIFLIACLYFAIVGGAWGLFEEDFYKVNKSEKKQSDE